MAYADHNQGSTRWVSIVIVALIHAVLGYAFVTGLAYQYVKKAAEQLNVVDVKEPPPPEEKPPPPPPDQPLPPPPVVSPPSVVQFEAPPSQITTVSAPPPAPPPPPTLAPPPPPPPPPPKQPAKGAVPRGDPASWATNDDYPPKALREERAGTTVFRVTVDTTGKVSACQITSSSGSPDLDNATCALVTRRARFSPAEDDTGKPMVGSYSKSIRWVIPKE